MTRLIIHIGHAKTGTTTLQSVLKRSSDALLEHGVLYPKPISAQNHIRIIPYLLGIEATPRWMKLRHAGDEYAILQESRLSWIDLTRTITSHRPDTIVLSSENLFQIGKFSTFHFGMQQLRALADEVLVVAYLRSPSAAHLSMKQQDLKLFGVGRAPEDREWYKESLMPFLDCPGISVKVHKFDRADLIGQDIVTDFAARYLPPAVGPVLDRSVTDENTSVSPEAMAIFEELHTSTVPHQYAHIGPISPKLSRLIRDADDRVPNKTSPRYKPGIARIVHDTNHDLDWVAKTFGFGFPPPEADPVANNIAAKDLLSVRSLCDVNETRYLQLWQEIPKLIEKPSKHASDQKNSTIASFAMGNYLVRRMARGFRKIGGKLYNISGRVR